MSETPRPIIDALLEHLEDFAIYFPAEFDRAILGHSGGLVVYDEDEIIEILMEQHEPSEEEGEDDDGTEPYISAREWFDFNMSQLGDGTPIFVRRLVDVPPAAPPAKKARPRVKKRRRSQ